MGAILSDDEIPQEHPNVPIYGYHFLQVDPDSPGSQAGFLPYFDFLTEINGVQLDKEDKFLENELTSHIGIELSCNVYNVAIETSRRVLLTPSDSWSLRKDAGVAGVSVRFCSIESAQYVWHVLSVIPGGPAALAGLEEEVDYIIGSLDLLFSGYDDFYNMIENCIGTSLSLYVYSMKTNSVRVVHVTPVLPKPNSDDGLLGCVISHGLLHQIPTSYPKLFLSTAPTQ